MFQTQGAYVSNIRPECLKHKGIGVETGIWSGLEDY